MQAEELLKVPVEIYNQAVLKKHPDANSCKHCGRLYNIVCICPKAQSDWQAVINEVREVSEMNALKQSFTKDDAAKEIIETLDGIGRDFESYEYGLPMYDENTMKVMIYRIKEIIEKITE